MNVGGNYYMVVFMDKADVVDFDVILVHWNDVDKAAAEYAKEKRLKYTWIKSKFYR